MNKQQLKKVQRKYINNCLNNKQIKIPTDTGSDLTIYIAETLKKIKCLTLSKSKT